jgi:hypothetical protein
VDRKFDLNVVCSKFESFRFFKETIHQFLSVENNLNLFFSRTKGSMGHADMISSIRMLDGENDFCFILIAI